MAYLEAAKQENFSRETLEVWYSEMIRRGWTEKDFRISILAVMDGTTYGKVKFEDFLNCQRLYGEEEINQLVNERIEARKKEFCRTLQPSEDELAKEGLIELQMYWYNKRRELVEKVVERLEKKCKTLRAQFYHLPEQAKIDLWTKAVQRGLVKDGDPFAMQVLPFLVPQMLEEFEEAIKNNSV